MYFDKLLSISADPNPQVLWVLWPSYSINSLLQELTVVRVACAAHVLFAANTAVLEILGVVDTHFARVVDTTFLRVIIIRQPTGEDRKLPDVLLATARELHDFSIVGKRLWVATLPRLGFGLTKVANSPVLPNLAIQLAIVVITSPADVDLPTYVST